MSISASFFSLSYSAFGIVIVSIDNIIGYVYLNVLLLFQKSFTKSFHSDRMVTFLNEVQLVLDMKANAYIRETCVMPSKSTLYILLGGGHLMRDIESGKFSGNFRFSEDPQDLAEVPKREFAELSLDDGLVGRLIESGRDYNRSQSQVQGITAQLRRAFDRGYSGDTSGKSRMGKSASEDSSTEYLYLPERGLLLVYSTIDKQDAIVPVGIDVRMTEEDIQFAKNLFDGKYVQNTVNLGWESVDPSLADEAKVIGERVISSSDAFREAVSQLEAAVNKASQSSVRKRARENPILKYFVVPQS